MVHSRPESSSLRLRSILIHRTRSDWWRWGARASANVGILGSFKEPLLSPVPHTEAAGGVSVGPQGQQKISSVDSGGVVLAR